ncbi:serine protease [Linnemannia hyalina]|uniref:Serine protease n=1 Tax=Linnemannia hyalina TaxID=64524 RepID=A0A9P7Y2B7_9FUNG|nr:serine protease [Linnemannia hyalina]
MFLATASFSLLMASQALATTVTSQSHDIAPLITPEVTAKVSPDSYIIVFKDGFKSTNFPSKSKQADPIQQSHDNNKAALWDEITEGIKHFIDLGSFQAVAGRFSGKALAEIRQHPAVAFVEHDTVGQRLSSSSSSPSETREYHSWSLAPTSTTSSAAISIAAAAQNTVLDTRSARIYLYAAQEHGENINISAADADMMFSPQDLQAADDATSTPELSTTSTDEKDITVITVTTTQAASSKMAFKLAEETQPVIVSTLRSNGNSTASDFIAVVDYIVRNQLRRTNGGGADEKKVSHDGCVLSVPFAFTNSRSMVLAVTKAFESGLHLALGNGVTVSNTIVEKL